MNLSDFIIIYLSCGSPFGVWFYFNNKNTPNIFLKSFFAGLLWIFFVFTLIPNKLSINKKSDYKLSFVLKLQKEIESHLPEQFSVFQFRAVFDRFTGLTFAEQDLSNNSSKLSNDFSARFNSRNEKISAKCLQRINRRKLKFHQIQARNDFLQIIGEVVEHINDPLKFLESNITFVNLIGDSKAEFFIKELIEKQPQIISEKSVKLKEVELWNKEKLRLPNIEKANFHLTDTKTQVMRMTVKD